MWKVRSNRYISENQIVRVGAAEGKKDKPITCSFPRFVIGLVLPLRVFAYDSSNLVFTQLL